jgi:hypothetical protein
VRNIYFRNASGQRTSFEWDQLTTAQQASFKPRSANTMRSDGARPAPRRLASRDRTVQGVPSPGAVRLRERTSSLGDIVNSSPRYVGTENIRIRPPASGADGRDGYQTFRFGKASRTPMVYIGANDGMLHAIRASDGIEQWAFIPSEFLATGLGQSPALAQLPRSDYAHRYYVDGQPVAGDAFFGNAWHTVMIVPMGAGGRRHRRHRRDQSDREHRAAGAVGVHPRRPRLRHGPAEHPAHGQRALGCDLRQRLRLNKSAKLFIVDIETGQLMTGPANARAPIDTDPDYNPATNPATGCRRLIRSTPMATPSST